MFAFARVAVSSLILGALAAPASAHPPPGHGPGEPEGGRLGITIVPMTPELRAYFGAEPDAGVLVSSVQGDSPAQKAGLAVGDVIVSAGGDDVRSPHELIGRVASAPAGESLSLRFVRAKKERSVDVALRGEPWPDWHGMERWFQEWGGRGVRELRRQLRELEDRLEQLEDRVEEQDVEKTSLRVEVRGRP